MNITVLKADLSEILPLRVQYLAEMNRQIRYNACHERGWSDSWLLLLDNVRVGYGLVKGREIKDRDSIFEFFVLEPYRRYARDLFRELILASRVPFIECQSNDPMLTNLLLEFSSSVNAESLLRWDSQKRRAWVSSSAPLHNLPQSRATLQLDAR